MATAGHPVCGAATAARQRHPHHPQLTHLYQRAVGGGRARRHAWLLGLCLSQGCRGAVPPSIASGRVGHWQCLTAPPLPPPDMQAQVSRARTSQRRHCSVPFWPRLRSTTGGSLAAAARSSRDSRLTSALQRAEQNAWGNCLETLWRCQQRLAAVAVGRPLPGAGGFLTALRRGEY